MRSIVIYCTRCDEWVDIASTLTIDSEAHTCPKCMHAFSFIRSILERNGIERRLTSVAQDVVNDVAKKNHRI